MYWIKLEFKLIPFHRELVVVDCLNPRKQSAVNKFMLCVATSNWRPQA